MNNNQRPKNLAVKKVKSKINKKLKAKNQANIWMKKQTVVINFFKLKRLIHMKNSPLKFKNKFKKKIMKNLKIEHMKKVRKAQTVYFL